MNNPRRGNFKDIKDSGAFDELQELWNRGDLEELHDSSESNRSSEHVHYRLKFEDTITNQNSLIESLKEALEKEKRKNDELSEEFYKSKESAACEIETLRTEIEELQIKLKNDEFENAQENEKLSAFEKQIEEKYSSKLAELENQLRLKTEECSNSTKDNEVLQDAIEKCYQRESILLKQIKLLTCRLDELYERGINHDNELEASRKMYEEELNQMKDALNCMKSSMPEELKMLSEQLAETKAKELSYRTQLNELNNSYEILKIELKECKDKLSLQEKQFNQMNDEFETQTKEQRFTLTNYKTAFMNLRELFDKISLLSLFLSNPDNSNSSSSFNPSDEFNDENLDKSTDNISDLFLKIKTALLEVEEIKTHIVSLCKDNEELYQENSDVKQQVDQYSKNVSSLEAEINDLSQKYHKVKADNLLLEDKCNNLEKEKTKLETDLNNINIKCQQLLSDKVSLEMKLSDFNNQYFQKMENIISQINYMKNVGANVENVPQTPSNETINFLFPPGVNNFATSTPCPPYMGGDIGESTQMSFNQGDYANFALLKWMEKCQVLNQENKKLSTEVENLKIQIKELEFSAQIFKDEMDIFEIKRKNLESKISDYEEKKKKLIEYKEENYHHLDEIDNLRDQVNKLIEKNNKLREDNLKLEEKLQNSSFSERNIKELGKISEKFVNDFNEKIKEIISLKGTVLRLQDDKDKLLKQVDKLNSSKNLYILKLEQTFEQLCLKEDEMEDLLREKIQAETESKFLMKKTEVFKSQIEDLKKLQETRLRYDNAPGLLEHLQKDLLNLYKNAVENKLEIDKLKIEKDCAVDQLDARHCQEILLKNNGTLQHENENLLQKLVEFQKLLHDYQQNQGFDAGWLLQLEEREKELLEEIREHRNQYARIEEALRSTGKLHNELQQQKDELRIKLIETSKLEKRLQEEKSNLKRAELKNHDLLRMLEEQESQLKSISEEKNNLEQELKTLSKRYIEVESLYSSVIKANEWRTARDEIMMDQNQFNTEITSLLEDGRNLYCGNENNVNTKFMEDIEYTYKKAVNDLKSYFTLEVAVNSSKEKEQHKQQVEELYEIIKQQSIKIEQLTLNEIERKLLPSENVLYNPSFKDLLDSLEKQKNDLYILNQHLNGNDAVMFKDIQTLIQKHFKTQLSLSLKALHEEHLKQYDFSFNTLKQLNREEVQLALLLHDADKNRNKQIVLENISVNNELSKSDKEQFNITTNSLSDLQFNEELKKSLLDKLKFTILGDYFKRIQIFFTNWNPLYHKEFNNLKNDLEKGIKNYENQISDDNHNNDNIIEKQKELINAFGGFVKSVKEENNIILQKLEKFVDIYNDKITKFFDDINTKYQSLNEMLCLQSEVDKLKTERDELEKQYESAISLLKSDHEAEERKVQILLDELKQYCESRCDLNALTNLRVELERKHKSEMEELRTYFEQKCADMEKNYSEEIFSQHSRKMSISSSCSEAELVSEKGFPDIGAGGDNLISELMCVNKDVDLLQYTPQRKDISVQISSENKDETKDISLDTLRRLHSEEIVNLNKSWITNLERLKHDLEEKYSSKIELLKEKLSPLLLKTNLDTVDKSVMVVSDSLESLCKTFPQKEASCQFESINDLYENELDFRYEMEEIFVDEMASSLTEGVFHKFENDARNKKIQMLCNLTSEKIKDLIQSFNIYSTNTEDKISHVLHKFNGLLNSFALISKYCIEQKHTITKLGSNVLQLQSEIEEVKMSTVKEITEKVKFLINDEEKENSSVNDPVLLELFEVINSKCETALAKQKEYFLKEINLLKQDYSTKQMETDFKGSDIVPTGIAEVDNVLKERENLKQVHNNLREAVTQLSSYINSSEDELIKTIANELIKICHESSTVNNQGQDKNLSSIEPNLTSLKTKIVRFAPNISDLIKEFDETSLTDSFNKTLDTSDSFRAELESCLYKLKFEAAALFGISTSLNHETEIDDKQLTREIMALQTEKEELLETVEDLRQRLENYHRTLNLSESNTKHTPNNEEYVSHVQEFDDQTVYRGNTISFTQDKVRHMIFGKDLSPNIIRTIEDIAKEADNLIEELQRERDDLQQQVDAADKQLKSTRQFLEEQAMERESERDEFTREVSNLQAQLKEKGKEQSSRERYTTEVLSQSLHQDPVPNWKTVEELSEELKESSSKLLESETQRMKAESELKAAVDKVWVLRDIISELEAQVSLKSEREMILEKKIEELEAEVEEQNGTQFALESELESVRNQSINDNCLDQIQELQDNIRMKFNSTVIRQFRTQIVEMEKSLDQLTKDIESLHVATSCNSLSSPSEEISLREQLDSFRCKTPEHCPSPVALPVDELRKLNEKLQRHARSQEVVIKKVKDQDLRISNMSKFIEELQREREVLQQQIEKYMEQLAQANNKVDYLRHKADAVHVSANRDLVQKNQELKEKLKNAEESLECFNNQLTEKEIQLARAEEILKEQNIKLRNMSGCDQEVVDSLRLELASVIAEKNKLEEELDKCKREMNIGMIDEILADKNEDIEHLQHTVTLLQSQVDNKQDPDKSHSRQSKGLHVSFAKDVSNTSFFSEDMKIRAAPFERSLELLPSNDLKEKHSSFCSDSSSEDILPSQVSIPEIHISSVIEPEERSMTELNLKAEIDRLKLELTEKAEKILLLENKLSDLQNMEEDLQLTKSQLEAVLSSVSEDKLYYEEKLLTMSSNLTKREEEVEYLNNLISEKDVEIMKTSADVKALQQILANLQEKLKEAQSLVETETITEIKKEIIDLREENIRLKSDINEKITLENTIKSLENEKKHLENSLEISENDKASLKTNVKLLENEKKNLEHLLELSEKDKVSFEVNVSLLENEKKKLENSLNLSEKDKASLEANVKLLENEKKKLENSLKLSEKDKASLEANVKLFENEKKKLEYSLEMSEKDKVSLEVNVKLLENVKKKLENSLEVLEKDKASLEANAMLLENEKKLLENKVADLESKKNFLETCIKSMEDDKVLLRSAIENIKENKDSINADLVESKKLLENEKQKYFNLKEDVILLTSENKKATEQLSSLMDQNNNLKKEAKDYENKLSEYMSFVKDVKHEIIKQNLRKIDINEPPTELDQSDDLTIVKTELNKLIALFGQIDFERKRNIEELQAMKNGNKNDMYSKEIEIKKLQNEITQLQSGILQIKNENKDKILSLEKEIRNLEEDVKNFQQLELEAKERLKKEILDKQKLSMKLEEMITNFNDLNTWQDDKKSNSSTAKPPIRLTISTPSYFEFLPETSGQEIDDLTEKLRMEAHLSAHLDKYIINNLVQESGLEEPHSQEGNCNCKNYQSTLIKKVSTLESMLRKEMDVGKELKSRLASGEKQLHELTSLKSRLENELSKNERLLKLRDKQVGEMSSQLKDMKTKIVQMEFCTSKEKILMKQLEKQFEEEKQKFLNSRKEDLLHLEDMRKRLEMFRESEGKLKKLLMEKQARCEELEAELNSYKALEKYDKDLESGRNVLSEQLDEQKTKIWQLTQHLETEQRIRKDLENVLMRERNALTALNNLLKEETRHKALLEKEISTLKRENAEIFNQRDAVENRFVSLLRSGTSSHERLLEKNRNAIESAHLVISVLEQECAGLKERIKHYEESDGTDVNFDLIRQINQFSSNIESLMKERSEFIKAIQDLKTERSVLHEEIESLKKAASANKNCQNSSMLSYPNIQLTAPKNVHCFPFRDEDSYIKFQTFVSISLRNESKKKSLVWQKKYLSIALRGYENLAKNTLAICGPKRRRTRGKKVTFRHLSMAVIAVVRMRMLIKLRYDKRNEVLNDIIQTMSFSSFHNQGANQIVENPVRVKSPKSSLQVQVPVLQHSPPSRDGPHRTFHSPSAESSSYTAQVEILRQRMKHIAQANKKN